MPRMTSTQKLPIVGELLREKPRIMPTMTAMPAAALANCWPTRATIWVRYDIVDSPT